jgi:hypothetical protein
MFHAYHMRPCCLWFQQSNDTRWRVQLRTSFFVTSSRLSVSTLFSYILGVSLMCILLNCFGGSLLRNKICRLKAFLPLKWWFALCCAWLAQHTGDHSCQGYARWHAGTSVAAHQTDRKLWFLFLYTFVFNIWFWHTVVIADFFLPTTFITHVVDCLIQIQSILKTISIWIKKSTTYVIKVGGKKKSALLIPHGWWSTNLHRC